MSYRDVVIVGSGFGGAVAAARLGEHVVGELGKSLLVLEKGHDHSGALDPDSAGPDVGPWGNRFRNSLSPEYLTGLTELFTDLDAARSGAPTMNVLTGQGLGGGSNVYCGVSLRAPASVFDRARGERRAWPASVTRAALDPFYYRAEGALRVHRLAWTSREAPDWQLVCKRDLVFAEGCRRIGATAAPLKVATFEDANDGWWTSGQVLGGRQNLSQNYLRAAAGNAVEMWSGCTVERIAPAGDGYVLSVTDRRGDRPRTFELECRVLILAAGAVGSTSLLMRSRSAFPDARRPRTASEGGVLGSGLSANGDYGVTGIVGADLGLDVESHKGKPMASFTPSFWQEHGFLIIPFYAEPLFPALGQISSLLPAESPGATGRRSTRVAPGARDWGTHYRDLLKQFGSRMLTMGCLALDECEGEIVADGDAPAEVRWPVTHPSTEARWSEAFTQMRRIYEALGGEIFADTYRTFGTVNTSHPLGGCRMSDDPDDGVVDPFGEVRDNPSLFVLDAAIIPAALGVNPSLTITALAERTCAALRTGTGTTPLHTRLA